MDLSRFDNRDFDRGRSRATEAAWRIIEGLFFNSWLPGSAWRRGVLRLFGARVGSGVVIKPHVRIKFPWRLAIGDNSWIGESAWIDNLDEVSIGNHCCISQGAYLCTGSHRWDRETFDLVTRPIIIEDHCWVGAKAALGPGVVMRSGAVLTMCSFASGELESGTVHSSTTLRADEDRRRG